jgi:hypothetical protein
MQKMTEQIIRDGRRPRRDVMGQMRKQPTKAPAWSTDTQREFTNVRWESGYAKSCWKEGSVRTPPASVVR